MKSLIDLSIEDKDSVLQSSCHIQAIGIQEKFKQSPLSNYTGPFSIERPLSDISLPMWWKGLDKLCGYTSRNDLRTESYMQNNGENGYTLQVTYGKHKVRVVKKMDIQNKSNDDKYIFLRKYREIMK